MKKWHDKKVSIERRVESLLKELTIEEKLGQLNYRNPGIPRLGIMPYVWWNEALHGVARSGAATVFPQAIAMAATFSPELVGKMGGIIAREGRIKYNFSRKHGDCGTYKGLTFWSPNVNIFRDPRWGRGHETYGECPILAGLLGEAYVNGVQSKKNGRLEAVATPKHYAVHSGPEACRLQFNSKVSLKDLHETYLPAFKRCITQAKARSIMTAYNAVNENPCSTSSFLLKDILRDEWQFDGAVVTDAGAGDALVTSHKTAGDYPEAVAAELHSGVDVLTDIVEGAADAYRRGLITEADVDRAVRNQFRVKFELELFDNNDDAAKHTYDMLECPAHRKVSLEAARRSMVLLKNDGILPLDINKIKSIAMIGPGIDNIEILLGNYHGTPTRYTTPLRGVLNELDSKVKIYAARGCEYTSNQTEPCAEPDDRIAEALTAAENADAVIMCLGLNPRLEGEAGDAYNSDAAGDKATLHLPQPQLDLLQKVAAVQKTIILVIISGSALIIPEEYCGSVIQCFYPGAEGGTALAEILIGKVNPSGKLPVTFYADDTSLPDFQDYSMLNRTYRFFKGKPQYPFGFGLSYTQFEYSELHIVENQAQITVKNIGQCSGEEVVQLYAKIDHPAAPLKQLAGLTRVKLHPGESKKVAVKVIPEALLLYDENGKKNSPPRSAVSWSCCPVKR